MIQSLLASISMSVQQMPIFAIKMPIALINWAVTVVDAAKDSVATATHATKRQCPQQLKSKQRKFQRLIQRRTFQV